MGLPRLFCYLSLQKRCREHLYITQTSKKYEILGYYLVVEIQLSGSGTDCLHNLNKRVADSENVSLECDGSDWSAAVMVDFLDEDNAEMLADRELRRLYAAMSKLTERQTEVIQLYFYKGMTLQEIAEELGITKPAVHYAMKGALKKMRKSF